MVKRLLVVLALLVSTTGPATADSIVASGKLTGKMPGGGVSDYGPTHSAQGVFEAGTSAGGSDIIFAYYYVRTFDAVLNRFTQCFYSGEFPMSAVKVTGPTMTVDFRHAATECWVYSYDPPYQSYRITVPSFDFTGTFTIASGGPGYRAEQSGNSTYTETWECAPAVVCTWFTKSTGSYTYSSAKFDGTIGAVGIQAPANGWNARWTVQKGQGTFTYSTRP